MRRGERYGEMNIEPSDKDWRNPAAPRRGRRPEGDDLYEYLDWKESGGANNKARRGGYGKRLTRGEAPHPNTNTRYLGNRQQLIRSYGVDPALIDELAEKLGYDPLDILPDVTSRQQFLQDLQYYQKLSDADLDVPGMLSAKSGYFEYAFDPELGGTYVPPVGRENAAARMDLENITRPDGSPLPDDFNKEIPTSTTNPARPRTVAAVWDPRRNIITVVFRDGTFYNYYECPQRTWIGFKSNLSKGRYILDELNNHPRGQADISDLPMDVREFLYRAARTAQMRQYHSTWKQPVRKHRYPSYNKRYATQKKFPRPKR